MAGIVKDRSDPALVAPEARGQAGTMFQTTIRLRADAHDDRTPP